LYSLSSIANHEHLIHQVGISKLKAHLQKAADSGETLDIMKYFSYLSFVCDIIIYIGTRDWSKAFIYRMLLANWLLADRSMH
jgi:hypothetical protein